MQNYGGRTHGMLKKRDGLNWLMIAAGALVTAVTVAFGGRYILKGSEKAKRSPLDTSAKDKASSPHYQDLYETNSTHIYETVQNETALREKSQFVVASQSEYEVVSYETTHPAPNDPSLQVSKICRQLS